MRENNISDDGKTIIAIVGIVAIVAMFTFGMYISAKFYLGVKFKYNNNNMHSVEFETEKSNSNEITEKKQQKNDK